MNSIQSKFIEASRQFEQSPFSEDPFRQQIFQEEQLTYYDIFNDVNRRVDAAFIANDVHFKPTVDEAIKSLQQALEDFLEAI